MSRDYEVVRSVTVSADHHRTAAVAYFEATGETPDDFGTTVCVSGRFVTVYPHDLGPSAA